MSLIKRLQFEVWVRSQMNELGDEEFYKLLATVLEKIQAEGARKTLHADK